MNGAAMKITCITCGKEVEFDENAQLIKGKFCCLMYVQLYVDTHRIATSDFDRRTSEEIQCDLEAAHEWRDGYGIRSTFDRRMLTVRCPVCGGSCIADDGTYWCECNCDSGHYTPRDVAESLRWKVFFGNLASQDEELDVYHVLVGALEEADELWKG